MTELSEARPALRPLRRFWWFVVIAALVAGGAAYVASEPSDSVTYGVINTRTVASLPNDRIDLISDLGTVITLPSVLEGPAEVSGLSVDELRDDVAVERIGSTTLARVTYTSDSDDGELAEDVLTALVTSAAQFLGQVPQPDEASARGPLQAAQDTEAEIAAAIASMVDANGGIEPDKEYAAMQNAALGEENVPPARADRLRAAFEEAQEYRALQQDQVAAANAVTSIRASRASRQAQQADLGTTIPVSFEGDVTTAGDITARARRVLGSAAGGALLAAALVLVLGSWTDRRRGRRSAGRAS